MKAPYCKYSDISCQTSGVWAVTESTLTLGQQYDCKAKTSVDHKVHIYSPVGLQSARRRLKVATLAQISAQCTEETELVFRCLLISCRLCESQSNSYTGLQPVPFPDENYINNIHSFFSKMYLLRSGRVLASVCLCMLA